MRDHLLAAAAALSISLAGAGAFAQTPAPGAGGPAAGGMTAGSAQAGARSGQTLTSVDELMGRTAKTAGGEEVGEVVDVLLDGQGRASQIVLELDDKRVAVEFSRARLESAGSDLQLTGLSEQQIRDLPEFEYDDSAMAVNAPSPAGLSPSTPPTR